MAEDRYKMMAVLKRVTDLRSELVHDFPFFGRLLLHLTPAVADCNTACTDMKRIIFDPDFVSRLSDSELRFVMLHELMHCVLKHCIRGKTLNNYIYNIACDIVVNSLIFESMDVDEFTVDNEIPMHIAPDGKEGREYTAEEVYRMLIKSSDGNGEPNIPLCANSNSHSDSHDNDSDGNQSLSSDNGKSDKTQSSNGMHTTDSHEIWESISADDTGKLADLWEAKIKQASKASYASTGSGIPQSIKRYLGETDYMPTTNWHNVLADFIVHNRADYTFERRDTRYSGKFIMPSFVENVYGDSVSNLWFCIDVSGSISDESLAVVFEEILSACRQLDEIEGKIAFFDTQMSDFTPFESEEDVLNIKPVGGGGTSFHCIFDRLNECNEDEKPVGIIILTDGYAYIPDESVAENIPVLWAIIDSDINPEWGTVIHIRS